ncbi:putative late blight resistance protein homolog R1A-4 isoform X2 [Salvia splendens]|uniref:putative late blight resistance protein homolog R1A-4 isoform X2 n=1 Tax=Salvia splendens TaxID=180675 RepID=UPI001C2589F4|nr:putative late blight resistance protein homolog R1A-4 isoform X2 [Salvia splendens]
MIKYNITFSYYTIEHPKNNTQLTIATRRKKKTMAYAAATSLKQTINRLLSSSNVSIDSSSRETLDITHDHLTSLQETLKKSDELLSLNSDKSRALEGKIRNAIHSLEDSLESKFLSGLEEEEAAISSLDLKEVSHEFNSFAEAVKKMKEAYNQNLDNPSSNSYIEGENASQQTIDCDVEMVGLSDHYSDLKDHVMRVIRPDDFGFFSFFGRPGTGRSLLARGVYDDTQRSFDCSAWVRIGSAYDLTQLLLNIISQINEVDDHGILSSKGEEELGEYVYTSLEGRRYMVALDDVRDADVLISLRRSLPEQNNGSVVLLTTGLIEVAEFDKSFVLLKPPTIDEDFIWSYILSIFFEGGVAPPEFEEIVRKIARNCGCLRLVVARIILILMRKLKKEAEDWNRLAQAQHDPVYTMDDELSEAYEVQKYLREDDQVWAKNLFAVSILIDKTKEILYPDRTFPKMGIMSIYGMAGVGKTTLVKKLFEDPSIMHLFHHCAWVNMGPKYKSEEILVDILAQLYPSIDRQNIKDDPTLALDLCTKKCLIVLDDLWSQAPVHILKNLLPNIRGELVVTTRLIKVAKFGPLDRSRKMRFLNKDESWDLLRDKVFGDEICPVRLETMGRKIAESCEGLPLLILSVADKLSGLEKTLEKWSMVASGEVPVIRDAEKEISNSLLPSYEALPQHLKACFLYMGGFPKKFDIPTSKLINLWFVEGFIEPNSSQTFEDFAARCFKELVDSTTVMVKKGSDLEHNKTCVLHPVFWHLSRREAIESKVFHILKICDVNSMEDSMKSQRRLCIPNSILLGIIDEAMPTFSTIRTLLCTGPLHQYPVPLRFKSRNLKVLEAVAIRFYEFPIEVVTLVQLRYLGLTCDGNLPPSISKLWNLQFMTVRQYLSIKSSSYSSYLPNEIWNMKELKHLHVSGQKLPNPDCEEALLPNLCSLIGVSVHSCTMRVLKRMPNLKKLGIQVELAPDDNSDPLKYLDHIYHLSKLESLKCVVVNPDLGLEDVAPLIPSFMLPSSLKKLSLSGLGYPWEYMKVIGKLPNLEVLKVRCYAFLGPTWEIGWHDFPQLKFLSIEDVDLGSWEIKMPSIQKLEFLSFKHCYNLEELPSYLPVCVRKIEVVESHPLSEVWAKKMKEKNWRREVQTLEHDIRSSWNDSRFICLDGVE